MVIDTLSVNAVALFSLTSLNDYWQLKRPFNIRGSVGGVGGWQESSQEILKESGT